jgi:hypothetical protein
LTFPPPLNNEKVDGALLGYVSLLECVGMPAEALKMATRMKKKAGAQGELTISELKDYTEATEEEQARRKTRGRAK